ncbi:hypothetical protein OAG19_00575 [Akkermansiaceae bacterium]|nr:hypothetical protein [Akkermansiaceae bacterium]
MSTGKTYSTKYLLDSKNNRGAEGQVLSSTDSGIDWVTLSEISGVDGTGTANYLSKWLDANTITNSLVYDNGTNVGIGTTNPSEKLTVHSTATAIATFYTTNASGGFTGYHNSTGGVKGFVGYGSTLFTGLDINNFGLRSQSGMPFATGGGNIRMYINSSGNVGIGTTNPVEALNVGNNGNIRIDGNASGRGIFASSNGSNNTFSFTRQDGVNTGDLSISGYGGVGLTGGRVTSPATSGYDLYVKNGGNVGIGTTNPSAKLEVATSANVNSHSDGAIQVVSSSPIAFVAPSNLNPSLNRWGFTLREGGEGHFGIRDYRHANTRVTIDDSGNVGIGTTSPSQKLHIHNGGIYATPVAYAGGADEWLLKTGAYNSSGWDHGGIKVRVSSGGQPRLSLMSFGSAETLSLYAGKVGIGTTSPAYPLDVSGIIKTSSSFLGTTVIIQKVTALNTNGIQFTNNGGSEKMRISDTGNVGIGTVSPVAKLDVLGTSGGPTVFDYSYTTNAGLRIHGDESALDIVGTDAGNHASTILLRNGNEGFGLINSPSSSALHFRSFTANADAFSIHSAAGVNVSSLIDVITLQKSGNVGIGNVSPQAKLHITGTVNTDDTKLYLTENTNLLGAYFKYNGDLNINFIGGLDTTERPVISYPRDGSTLSLSTGSSTALHIDSSRNVGIGTNSPTAVLDVAGAGKFTGQVTIPATPSASTDAASKGYVDAQVGSADTLQEVTDNGNTTTNSIGIGTTSPTNKLDIRQSSSSGSDVIGTGAITIGSDNPYWTFRGTATSLQDLAFDRNYSGTWYESMRIQRSTGNVGIGTTSPEVKLHVGTATLGAAPDTNADIFSSGGVTLETSKRLSFDADYYVHGNIRYIGSGTAEAKLEYQGYYGHNFITRSSSRMVISGNTGNVGIGTTGPATKLHVVGRARFDDTQINAKGVFADYFSSGQSLTLNSGASANILFKIGNTTALTLDSSQNATFAGDVSADNITSISNGGSPSIYINSTRPTLGFTDSNSFTDANDIYIVRGSSGNKLQFQWHDNSASTTTETFNIDNAGNATFAGDLTVSGGDITLGGTGRIQGVDTVTDSTDAANKAYVDAQVGSADTLQEVTDNGNTTTNSIGIGTTNPSEKLHVFSSSDPTIKIGGGVSEGTTGGTSTLQWYANNGSVGNAFAATYYKDTLNDRLTFIDGGAVNVLTLKNGGNVGIGTTSPSAKLELVQSVGSVATNIINGGETNFRFSTTVENTNTYTPVFRQGIYFSSTENATIAYCRGGSSTGGFLTFQTNNGNERMRIDTNGNVGIGTTSPSAPLTVKGADVGATDNIAVQNSSGTKTFSVSNNGQVNIGGSQKLVTSDASIELRNNATGLMAIKSASNYGITIGDNGGETMRINTSTDRVGIGTTNPSSKLEVAGGDLRISNATTDARRIIVLQGTATDARITSSYLGASTYVPLTFYTNNAERVRIDTSGNVGIGTTNPTQKLDVRGNAQILTTSGNSGLRIITSSSNEGYLIFGDSADNSMGGISYDNVTNSLSLDSNNAERVRIDSSGNVGIGTTNPTGKLQIGDDYTINSSFGGSDLYIKSTSSNISSYDPRIYSTSELGSLITISDSNTTGPTKAGLVLYNDDVTVGGFSPMLLFSKRESGSTPYKATMAGIYARSPLGTGNGNSWIDGELIFATAGASSEGVKQRMVINKEGNVGIGTTNPTVALDVVGAGKFTGQVTIPATPSASTDAASKGYVDAQVGSADTLQEVTDNGATTTNNISIGTTSTFTAGGTAKLSVSGLISWGASSSDLSYFRRLSAGNFQWQTYNGGNSGNIHLQPYGGNVGIGTTNPIAPLDVDGNIYSNGALLVDRILSRGGSTDLKLDARSGYGVNVRGSGNASIAYFDYDSGNVGIGTTSPSSKLTVGGNATGFSTGMQVWQSGETALNGDVGGKAATFFGTSGLSNSSIVNIYSTDAYTTQRGGEIGFGGKYRSTGGVAQFAKIRSFKTNSSDGGANYGGGLEFWTRPNGSSAVARMTILGDGNVGIGTTNPSRKFEVHEGNVYLKVGAQSGYADSYGPILTTNSGSMIAPERVYLAASQAYIRRENIGGQGLTLHGDTFSRFTYYNGSSTVEALRIDNSGNVGIGTTNPADRLHLGASSNLLFERGGELRSKDTGGATRTITRVNSANELEYGWSGAGPVKFMGGGSYAEKMRIHTNGNVGIGTTNPSDNLTVEGGGITLGGTGRIQGVDTVTDATDAANKAYVDAQVGSADTLQEVTDNGNTTTNGVGIGTTSVTALLNIATPSSTNVKVTKIAGDTTTVYRYATLADAVLEWTCGSYHNAEVVITASQTNSGTYNNLYIRGIWSNNHTSHHWDELEHIGGLTGTTFTITNGQNGSTTNSGRLTLDVDYINGSFATLNIRITDFFGTHAYTIT